MIVPKRKKAGGSSGKREEEGGRKQREAGGSSRLRVGIAGSGLTRTSLLVDCDNVNIVHLFYIYTTVVVIATILCNMFSTAIVEPD